MSERKSDGVSGAAGKTLTRERNKRCTARRGGQDVDKGMKQAIREQRGWQDVDK
jgi:hypothetical protein